MPYEITQDVLDELVVRSFEHEEIEVNAEQAGLNKDYLRSQLRDKASEIRGAAVKETEAYNQLEDAYKALASKVGDPQKER